MYLNKLESIRGIAALMVAFGHSLLVLSIDNIPNIWAISIFNTTGYQSLTTKLLLIIFNSGAAVTLFFVLSGYVLGLSLDKKAINLTMFIAFYIKRVFRIYPAHIVCIISISILIHYLHTYIYFQNTSEWFNWWYKNNHSLLNVIDNALIIDTNLNPVSWTLQIEIITSLIFPLAYCLSRNISTGTNLFVLFTLILLGENHTDNIYIVFGFVFYIGIMLPSISKIVNQYLPTSWHSLTLTICSIIFLCSRLFFLGNERYFAILAEAVSAPLLVIILTDDRKTGVISNILNLNIIKKLGRLSYSFYIYHFIVLYLLSYHMLLFC